MRRVCTALGVALVAYWVAYWLLAAVVALPGLVVVAAWLALLAALGYGAWTSPVREDLGRVDRDIDEHAARAATRPLGNTDVAFIDSQGREVGRLENNVHGTWVGDTWISGGMP